MTVRLSPVKRASRAVILSVLVAPALALGLAACGASTSSARGGGAAALPRPPALLVLRFSVNAEDVVVDTLGPDFRSDATKKSEQQRLGREVSEKLATAATEELRRRGLPAQQATIATRPPLHALLVKGQFITVDEGSKAKRMTVGLGAGAEKVRVRVQVYQVTEAGLVRVDGGMGEASGRKTPGVAIPVGGAGVAAGRVATSAAISGGVNLVQERSGIDATVAKIAKQMADEAMRFYKRNGWL